MAVKKIVIIGAGQASANAVSELRRQGFEGNITIISDEQAIFYERPPLSKSVLLDNSTLEQCAIFSSERFAELSLHIIYDQATAIDPLKKCIQLAKNEPIIYDKLLIATGSTPLIPVQDWSKLDIETLRTFDDAERIRKKLLATKRLALIGGGWIGLELAASARQLGLQVEIFERAERLCARHLTHEVSEYLADLHITEGVKVHFNVQQLTLAQQEKAFIIQAEGKSYHFDTVVVGTGVKLNTELALTAGLLCQHGIVVNHHMQTSNPDIYAAGDVIAHPTFGFSLQTWANANETGVTAARSMLNIKIEESEIPWFWSDQYQHNVQIIGLRQTEDQLYSNRQEDFSLFIYADSAGKINQAIAFNHPRFIKQVKRWMKKNQSLDLKQLSTTSDWMKLM